LRWPLNAIFSMAVKSNSLSLRRNANWSAFSLVRIISGNLGEFVGPSVDGRVSVDPIGAGAHCGFTLCVPPTFDPREEPGALAVHAGICAGGEEKSPSRDHLPKTCSAFSRERPGNFLAKAPQPINRKGFEAVYFHDDPQS
jgi:hypothetical protein